MAWSSFEFSRPVFRRLIASPRPWRPVGMLSSFTTTRAADSPTSASGSGFQASANSVSTLPISMLNTCALIASKVRPSALSLPWLLPLLGPLLALVSTVAAPSPPLAGGSFAGAAPPTCATSQSSPAWHAVTLPAVPSTTAPVTRRKRAAPAG